MAFADPSVITINAVAKNLVKIDPGNLQSGYRLRSATDNFDLYIRNNSTRVDKKTGVVFERHNIQLIHTVFPVSPSTLSTVRMCSVTFENQVGDTLTDPLNMVVGLLTFLTASSGANISKMLNGES
jgi:protein-disulfide isomerase-like protein with CxxC motif